MKRRITNFPIWTAHKVIKKIHYIHFGKIVCGLSCHLMNEKTSLFCKQLLTTAYQWFLAYDGSANQIAAFASIYQQNSTTFRLHKKKNCVNQK